MASESTIPLLPCRSIDAVLEFYQALGFGVTYQQAKPNTYAVVQRGGIELHFFAMREYDRALAQDTAATPADRVQALVARAGLAVTIGEQPLARRLLADLGHMPLEEHDRNALQPDLERAADLEHGLP